MQEKLAKKLICPFMQHIGIMGNNFPLKESVLDTNIGANVTCMTTQCMAWRKTYTMDDTNTDGYCHLLEKK